MSIAFKRLLHDWPRHVRLNQPPNRFGALLAERSCYLWLTKKGQRLLRLEQSAREQRAVAKEPTKARQRRRYHRSSHPHRLLDREGQSLESTEEDNAPRLLDQRLHLADFPQKLNRSGQIASHQSQRSFE